jgi:acetolactate synthase-1/2/3 large subunit
VNTGARTVLDELRTRGVEVCFANPGTSEMHFVAALDDAPQMRAVLCLFEGVAAGAADGYARVAGKPAATLLHLGPGLANGLANLHNARRAHTPVVNIIGDHATHHHRVDAPLESDIELLAQWLDSPVFEPRSADQLRAAVADTVAAAQHGRVATLILPADISWQAVDSTATPHTPASIEREEAHSASDDLAPSIVRRLAALGDNAVLLLGGRALTVSGLEAAQRISEALGTRVLVETFPARLPHGGSVPHFERLGYLAEHVAQQFTGTSHLFLAGARRPVAFFAYPGTSSHLVPDKVSVLTLTTPTSTSSAAVLEDIADALTSSACTHEEKVLSAGPRSTVRRDITQMWTSTSSTAPLTPLNWAPVVGNLLPPDAIISDESNTSGLTLPAATADSPRHDVLTLTGGAIGQGLPVALGAAVAAPSRPVIAVQADGSALYAITALWTMARERLDITTIILSNRAYAILQLEMHRMNAAPSGSRSGPLLSLDNPAIDFVAMAEGLGVPATRASTTGELAEQFRSALAAPGPHLIEADLTGVSGRGLVTSDAAV